jgi:ABC-type transporter MlaC component
MQGIQTHRLLISALVLLVTTAASAQTSLEADARSFTEASFSRLGEILKDAAIAPDQKRALLRTELGNQVAFGVMAHSAIGDAADDFSTEQVAEFTQEMTRYLTDLLIRRMAGGQVDEITGVSTIDAERKIVAVDATGNVGFGHVLEYYTRTHKKTDVPSRYVLNQRRGKWQFIAIQIDGVDIARTLRGQLGAASEKLGPEALIAELQRRNNARDAENPFS